ncbi:non-ribosomal peptide synthetase [Burkholderia sp. WSM2232]|uniref:non-ribosomal peptide synthetase n=1 Tax=Burkholderia sp. WSM2232 TaxID=944436 RepID=UPI0004090991|nr:non-ribosomal peptide synthetase [Burkholderia sp. WSM2232]
MIPFRTLKQLIDMWFPAQRTATAIIVPGEIVLSYEGLAALVARLRQLLLEEAISPRSRVGLVAPRGWQGLAGFLAISSLGACAPLNPSARPAEIESDITQMGLDVIVGMDCDASIAAAAVDLGIQFIQMSSESIVSKIDSPHMYALPSFTDAYEPEPLDTALLMKTSGSTGKPKVVELTHSNILASTQAIATMFSLGPKDRCLNLMPMFHVHGLLSASVASLIGGSSVVCVRSFDANATIDYVGRLSPTWITAAPTMHLAILRQLDARGSKMPASSNALRFVRSSSAPMPFDVIQRLEDAYGAPLIETYGLTESSSLIASNPLPPGKRKVGSVGQPVGAEIRVLDAKMVDARAGEVGEVVVRGPSVITQYSTAGDQSNAFHDGWLRTGDGGYLDSDGYLYITHRLKEVIKRGGNQVVPTEVDAHLRKHVGVLEAVTFAIAHPTLGEDVAAALVVETAATFDVTQVRRRLAEQVSLYKVPSHLYLVAELPKNHMGKIVRKDVAKFCSCIPDEGARSPSGPTEQLLHDIWCDWLRVGSLHVTANLFLAGADVILARGVSDEIHRNINVRLSPRELFLAPTIEQQALIIGERSIYPTALNMES